MHGCIRAFYLIPLILFLLAADAVADIADLDSYISSFLSPAIANAMVKTVGMSMDHRSYEPATALGTDLGIDFGVEVTISKPPPELSSAIGTLTGSNGLNIPLVPSVKLHLHKGLGKRVDVGFSSLPPLKNLPLIGGSFLIGGDLKVVVWQDEEGPTWAIRTSYNMNELAIEDSSSGVGLSVKTVTITPQILMSKKLSFADPYLGVGYQYTYGSTHATITIPQQPIPLASVAPIELTRDGRGQGAFFFGGVGFRVPHAGFKITLELSYSPIGITYFGTKVGFQL